MTIATTVARASCQTGMQAACMGSSSGLGIAGRQRSDPVVATLVAEHPLVAALG